MPPVVNEVQPFLKTDRMFLNTIRNSEQAIFNAAG